MKILFLLSIVLMVKSQGQMATGEYVIMQYFTFQNTQ